MQNNLTSIIEAPFNYVTTYISLYSVIIISLISGIFLAFLANRNFKIITIIISVVLAFIIYLLLSNARGSNIVGSVPSVGYPIPPHLGLGAVSIENRYPSKVGYS